MRRLWCCFLAIQIIMRLPLLTCFLCEIGYLILVLTYPLVVIYCFVVAEEIILTWNFGKALILKLFSIKACHFVLLYFIFKATFFGNAVFKIPNIKFSYSWRVSDLLFEGDICFDYHFYFVSCCIDFPDAIVNNWFGDSTFAFVLKIFKLNRFFKKIRNIIFCEWVPEINELELFALERVYFSVYFGSFAGDTIQKLEIDNGGLPLLHLFDLINCIFNAINIHFISIKVKDLPH